MVFLGQDTKYIAAGCIVVDEASSNVPHPLWTLPGLKQQWHSFRAVADESEGNGDSNHLLPLDVEQHLISKKPLSQYKPLLRSRWIQFIFRLSANNPTQGIVRVYILPDDVDNVGIPRSNPQLWKLRLKLLGALDFSESTWRGEIGDRLSSPALFDDPGGTSQSDNDQSLLGMFNNIPSPEPSPNIVQNPYVREAIDNLLNSSVPGLHTPLRDYQRLSAALMLQREEQPEQIVDPRLVKVVDQEGKPWYNDATGGVALKEPRFYDRPRGGILAEEMGCGKTLICLSLILATKSLPSETPELYWRAQPVVRDKVGSLADMAAACITMNSVPRRDVFLGSPLEYANCTEAVRRNPGYYERPSPIQRRQRRLQQEDQPPLKIFHSHASLVVVPPNLIHQWQQEIKKHMSGLNVLLFRQENAPSLEKMLEFDLILISSTRVEQFMQHSASAQVHFKRCIVDEGHRLGNSTTSNKSDLHLAINRLHITSKWVVTGTPSKGLYGVGDASNSPISQSKMGSKELEKDDLRRIGSIASHFLNMRPWANSHSEVGSTDKTADWVTYVMPSKNAPRGRRDCLRSTLNSMIVRHRLSDVENLLPRVQEKVVYLEPSYQDTLVLNLFSSMIIFNSVQSQRTDRDYFFHPHQRRALLELVSNLRQSSFFGGSFFSPTEILKASDTATQFLAERKIPISSEDEALLNEAIQCSRIAADNTIKRCANLFRELPLYLNNFPWAAGEAWSLDSNGGDTILTDSPLVLELQKFLHPLVESPVSLQLLFKTGKFEERGREERLKAVEAQNSATPRTNSAPGSKELAGHTRLGQDNSSPNKRRSAIVGASSRIQGLLTPEVESEVDVAEPLARTQLISTASAKLSYLLDQIVKHQDDEQMIIFYENENVAYYLAGALEMLQVHHLIYAKGISPDRRAQYVNTFNNNRKFRVLLMDITQAAFGLDMRSASRIYFINPVLNPQVQAQAIGRARRISQNKPVTVETLVLRGSIEEVIVKRRGEMSQAEIRKTHSILDDKPIYEWILNAKILPLPRGSGGEEPSDMEQMAKLERPQVIFGRGFGRDVHPDQDILTGETGKAQRGGKHPKEEGAQNGSVLRGEGLAGGKRQEPASPRPEAGEMGLKAKKPRVTFA
ncbi:P-loop containing nucleoside triphosphate hydrolase protein [Cercophora newfieldiana]|uniref:P-loop containing nucleoside triphosphate hydrolase protein n=1 Tax=Cercophora newfieldiana TaxID=92897 RepID=A0AA39YPH3_9PEZI|nr:P-loop containing nucleoside triphosphate hydrolase protein [Cercophora newfieldiana]